VLEALERWSLRRARLVLSLALLAAAAAAVGLRFLSYDLLPALQPPQAVVTTEAPGLSPAQVEQLVTQPLEVRLGGAPGVAEMRSASAQGLSTLTLTFADGVDPARARQAVAERVALATGELPPSAAAPQVAPLTAAGGPLLQIGLTGATPQVLRREAEWTLRQRLLAIPGVAQVAVYGGEVRRIEIRGRPGDLSDSDLGLLDLVNAAARTTGVIGAGFVDTPQQRILIDPSGQARTKDEIAAGQIEITGAAPTRIGDVADVDDQASAPGLGAAVIDGQPGVLLVISAQPGAAPLTVTHAVDKAMGGFTAELQAQDIHVASDLARPADEIRRGIRGALWALLAAAVVLAVVTYAALRCFRATFVSLASLAASLLLTGAFLAILKVAVDAVTLAGLTVGLGVIIDDAVLDVEFALSRLREDHNATRVQALLRAALEVRGPVFIGSALVAAALAPWLFLGGPAGALMRPMAAAALTAVAASLLVTATLTPALALVFFPEEHRHEHGRVSAGGWAQATAGRVSSGWALGLVAVAAGAAVLLGVLVRFEPWPALRTGAVTIAARAAPSLSRDAAAELYAGVARAAKAVPGVAHVAARIGRDPTDASGAGLDEALIDVTLTPGLGGAARTRTEQGLRQVFARWPGLTAQVADRVTDSAPGGPVWRLDLYGSDLEALDAAAGAFAGHLKGLPGAREVGADAASTTPAISANVDFTRLPLYGLSTANVLETIEAAFAGKRVATVYDGAVPVDVVVLAGAEDLGQPEQVGRLLLRSTSGVSAPLASVADVRLEEARARIDHLAGQRSVSVTADPPPGEASAFAKAARQAAARFAWPQGVTPGAPAEPGRRLAPAVVIALLASLAAMAAVLLVGFRNPRTVLVVLAGAVLALAAALAAVLVTGGRLDLGGVMGLVAVFGLSSRTGILLCSRADRLTAAERRPWDRETATAVAADRALPTLTSALLVTLAITPFAVVGGPAEALISSMLAPVAGGLIGGGVLGLLLLPALMLSVWRPLSRPERGDR
jgi:multidrug efflux pump subunit AcrB